MIINDHQCTSCLWNKQKKPVTCQNDPWKKAHQALGPPYPWHLFGRRQVVFCHPQAWHKKFMVPSTIFKILKCNNKPIIWGWFKNYAWWFLRDGLWPWVYRTVGFFPWTKTKKHQHSAPLMIGCTTSLNHNPNPSKYPSPPTVRWPPLPPEEGSAHRSAFSGLTLSDVGPSQSIHDLCRMEPSSPAEKNGDSLALIHGIPI